MGFENQSDRDILISTAVEVRELSRRVGEYHADYKDDRQRVHGRLKSLERERWFTRTAILAMAGSVAPWLRRFLGMGG